MLNSEPGILKPKVQRNKTVVASRESKPKGVKPKVLSDQKLSNFQHKAQGKKSRSEIFNIANMPKSKGKAKIMVPRQRLLKTYDKREVYVPYTNNERWRKCEIWRQPSWQNHWYMNYW